MAEVWSRLVTLPAGQTNGQTIELGPRIDRVGYDQPPRTGSLRVGFLEPPAQLRPLLAVRATVKTPDGVLIVGPIDLPLVLGVELPVVVTIMPDGAPLATLQVAALASVEAPIPGDGQATYSVACATNASVAVPIWAARFSVFLQSMQVLPAVWELHDLAGGVVATGSAANWYGMPVPRGSRTLTITSHGPALIVWHY
jgi:hypothetical protein